MNNSISPLRRIAVTLVLTGVTALGAVSIAPAAFADESSTVQTSVTETPAVESPAVEAPAVEAPVVVTPPEVVYDKDGKPVKAPKVCTAKDLSDVAKKIADATKKAAPLLSLADKSRDAAVAVRAQIAKVSPAAGRLAELVAQGLDKVADKLEAQAADLVAKASVKSCIVLPTGGRF
jgi:hypothetical protein